MKRKLNEHDVPEAVNLDSNRSPTTSFESFDLDPRLLQAVSKQKYVSPTPVQQSAIPEILRGRNIIATAKTGSGKTAAYALPVLQSILKTRLPGAQTTSALILVPTRELASQVAQQISALSAFCGKSIQCINITTQLPDQAQRALLSVHPDVVVSTPARAAKYLNDSSLKVETLHHVVIDEADLLLSYGYEEDLQNILAVLPKVVQHILVSATITGEVERLRKIIGSNFLELNVNDSQDPGTISQYVVQCAEDEKFLYLFALFKLRLIKGKCIVFVGDVDRSYRLKLYLEQFGIKSCVLNSELPVNSRIHVVEEFNKNVYDIIIASDEHEVIGNEEGPMMKKKKTPTEPLDDYNTREPEARTIDLEITSRDAADTSSGTRSSETSSKDNAEKSSSQKPRQPHTSERRKDREYGIARGIDFERVVCVLNFDLPSSSRSYTHRIGRTARAGRGGIALSFAVAASEYRKHKLLSYPPSAKDPAIMTAITVEQQEQGKALEPYHFDLKKLEGFKYRVGSALKAVTPGAIREARIRELRQEMLKSEKLKRHLEENPDDLKWVRHDIEATSKNRLQPHLKHVPDYLLPGGQAGVAGADIGFVGIGKVGKNRIREARKKNRMKAARKSNGRKSDPLKTFNAKGRGR